MRVEIRFTLAKFGHWLQISLGIRFIFRKAETLLISDIAATWVLLCMAAYVNSIQEAYILMSSFMRF